MSIEPDDKMSGYLGKSTIRLQEDEEGEDLLGKMISGIGSGLQIGFKMFTDTI